MTAAPPSSKKRLGRAALPVNLGGTLLLVLLLFLTVYPLIMLLYGSFRSAAPGLPGEFNFDGYINAYSDPLTYETWANSLLLAISVTTISTSIAALFAFIVARTDTPLRQWVMPMMTLIYVMPGIFFAFAWAMLGTPRAGLINVFWMGLFPEIGPLINVYSWPGLILIASIITVPFKFLLVLGAFYGMDMSLEEAARVSGAGRWKTLLLVDLPLLAPAVLGVFILGFIRGLQSLEVPLFIGFPARIYVFSTRIFDYIRNYFPAHYQEAAALCVTLIAALLLLVLVQWRLLGNREFITITGKGYRPEVWRLGKIKYLFSTFIVLYALLALVLPATQLLLGSFSKIFGIYAPNLLTLDNYRAAIEEPMVQRAVVNTLVLSAVGGLITMALTTAVAYIVARTNYRFKRLLDLAVWVPWTLPGIVLGIALLWAYLSVPGLRSLYGTSWLLLLGVVVTVIPVGVRVMAGSLVQLSKELEESSRVLGASWRQSFLMIVLPLVSRSFMYGWLVVAIIISGELSVPLLLYAPGAEVLSVAILALQVDGKPTVASAVFSMVLLGTALVIVLVKIVTAAIDRWSARRAAMPDVALEPRPA